MLGDARELSQERLRELDELMGASRPADVRRRGHRRTSVGRLYGGLISGLSAGGEWTDFWRVTVGVGQNLQPGDAGLRDRGVLR